MTDDRDTRSVATPERHVGHNRAARSLRRRPLRGPEAVEAYLRASSPPRYMRRLREIELGFELQRQRLEASYAELAEACAGDWAAFSTRWRAQATAWRFGPLNELIREHNAWYPVEADLPMSPRTGDYVAVRGGSYRRLKLGADWILEHLPPILPRDEEVPELPRRPPREPLAGPRPGSTA